MALDPYKIKTDPCYFIENVIKNNMPDFQKEWLGKILGHRRVCFMAFRSSGKTSQLFENFFIWNAVVRPKTKYVIVSKTLPQAREILKEIKTKIITNPYLCSLIPVNRSQSWSASEIELANHSRIIAKAYNGNVRGLHVDGVGCDEMGEYDDHEIFKKAILPIIRAKRGFFIGVGTPKSELDMLHEIERDPGHSSIHFDRYPAEGPKGNLFEKRYPDVRIEHKEGAVHIVDKATNKTIETYNNMTWSQEFLLKPVSMQDRLFPDHLIEACLDNNLTFLDAPVNMRQYFMGVDFAMSAQSGSDFTVVTVLEKSPSEKRLRIALVERYRGMDYVMQKARIKEIADKFQVIKVLGDENSFGKTFIYDLAAAGVPIEGYKFTHQSGSKEELIKSLRDQFDKQGFIIPYAQDQKSFPVIRKMIEELTKFGIVFDYKKGQVKFEGSGEHDDMVISLGLANFIARHITMGIFSAIKGSERKSPFAVAVR